MCILSAIANRDPEEAQNVMRNHLETIEGYLEEYAGQMCHTERTTDHDEKIVP